MQNLLFVQIAESTFDESLFISRLANQLRGDVRVICLVNGISSALVASNPDHIVGVLTENQDDNLQRFQGLLEQTQPDAIIVLDLYKFFLNPLELNFLPAWLEEVKSPILALDYYHLLTSNGQEVRLNQGVQTPHLESGESAEALALNVHLIKPVPPVLPQLGEGDQSYYWNLFDPGLAAAAPQLREQVLDSLKIESADTKVITLFFDPTLFSQALDRNLLGFYFVVIEVLIYYVRSFQEQQFRLMIVGSAAPTENVAEFADKNFDLNYFTHLTEDNYRALLSASDLLISNTNWSPALLDAAFLGKPTVVMGNSIIQEWKDATEGEKELKSFFSPAPPTYELCHLMVQLNQWSVTLPIFPFINYPARHESADFPEPGLQAHALPYFLLDMFDDESSLAILNQLLLSEEQKTEYQKLCQEFCKVSDQALKFDVILEMIKQKQAS
jgi:hypothetical protein